jgi:hypothetical protein
MDEFTKDIDRVVFAPIDLIHHNTRKALALLLKTRLTDGAQKLSEAMNTSASNGKVKAEVQIYLPEYIPQHMISSSANPTFNTCTAYNILNRLLPFPFSQPSTDTTDGYYVQIADVDYETAEKTIWIIGCTWEASFDKLEESIASK